MDCGYSESCFGRGLPRERATIRGKPQGPARPEWLKTQISELSHTVFPPAFAVMGREERDQAIVEKPGPYSFRLNG